MTEPLVFCDNLHSALWGKENWLISAHPSSPSVIANGAWQGRGLNELYPNFPVLIKVIDAKTRLSVQVHPNERTAPLTGGEPKTEMWCLLDDGFVYAGLKRGVGPDEVERAVADGSFEELLVRHEGKTGDVFFIPGGLVHAIGDKTRIFEVQQSSNTTYRLYDWNRVGPDGKGRELHVAAAKMAIDYALPAPARVDAVHCPFFNFEKVSLKGRREVAAKDGFAVLYLRQGEARVNGYALAVGTAALMPRGSDFTLEGAGEIFSVVA